MHFLCDTVYVPYCTFHAVSKRNALWVALINTGSIREHCHVLLHSYRCILLCFYCYRNVLRRFRIKISGSVHKKWMLYPPNPSLNLADSVHKCKTDMKTYLLTHLCHYDSLINRFDLLYRTVFTQDSIRRSSPPKLPNKLTVSMKTHRYESEYVRC